MDSPTIKFPAEVIEVKIKKTASLDREYKVVLITDSPEAIRLSGYVNEQAVSVSVSPADSP